MPFKSQAQRRKFHAMAASGHGGITTDTIKEWDSHTTRGLPESVKKAFAPIAARLVLHTARAKGYIPPKPEHSHTASMQRFWDAVNNPTGYESVELRKHSGGMMSQAGAAAKRVGLVSGIVKSPPGGTLKEISINPRRSISSSIGGIPKAYW
jgi:hypothetical protein